MLYYSGNFNHIASCLMTFQCSRQFRTLVRIRHQTESKTKWWTNHAATWRKTFLFDETLALIRLFRIVQHSFGILRYVSFRQIRESVAVANCWRLALSSGWWFWWFGRFWWIWWPVVIKDRFLWHAKNTAVYAIHMCIRECISIVLTHLQITNIKQIDVHTLNN